MPDMPINDTSDDFAEALVEIAQNLRGAEWESFWQILPQATDVAIRHRRECGFNVTATVHEVIAKFCNRLSAISEEVND
jgi:hypothetical protein